MSQALVGSVIHSVVSRFNIFGVLLQHKQRVWIGNVNVFVPFLNSVVILSGFLHCLQSTSCPKLHIHFMFVFGICMNCLGLHHAD